MICRYSLRSWRDSWARERRRSRILPLGLSLRGISRAAKPRVNFPPATFCMVFACRPILSVLINQLNKPIRERSVTWNLRSIFAWNGANACDPSEINPWFTRRSPTTQNTRISLDKRIAFSKQSKATASPKKMYKGKHDNRDNNLPTVLGNTTGTGVTI